METLVINGLRIRTSLFISKDTFQKANVSVNIINFFYIKFSFYIVKTKSYIMFYCFVKY